MDQLIGCLCLGWSGHRYLGTRCSCRQRNTAQCICFYWIQWCCSCNKSGARGRQV